MERKDSFAVSACRDCECWQAQDIRKLKRISGLAGSVRRDPSAMGIGKSELLRGNLAGWRPKRTGEASRMVCRLEEAGAVAAPLRFRCLGIR